MSMNAYQPNLSLGFICIYDMSYRVAVQVTVVRKIYYYFTAVSR